MNSTRNKSRRPLVDLANDTSSNSHAAPANNNGAKKCGACEQRRNRSLEDFCNERSQQMEQDCDLVMQEQRQLFMNALFKITKKDRNMKLEEYENEYGDDLLQCFPPMSLPEAATSAEPHLPVKQQAFTIQRQHAITKATPMSARTRRPITTPATVRSLRPGEIVYSERGSPLNPIDEKGSLVLTVKAPRHRPAGEMTGTKHSVAGLAKEIKESPSSPEIDFNLGSGQYLSLKDADNLDRLDSNAKEEAAAQIRLVQDRMNRILQRLTDN